MGLSITDTASTPRLRGHGQFVADVPLTDPLHLAFLRSPIAYGAVLSLDLSDALRQPGVYAAHLAADVSQLGALTVNPVLPLSEPADFPILAGETIGSVGQPIAAILAETPSAALDGIDVLAPDLTAQAVPDFAPKGVRTWRNGDVDAALGQAAYVVEVTLRQARLAPASLEPRAIAVEWAPGGLTIWHSTQTPHRTRSELARILGLDPTRIRVIAPDVGGAFGMKSSLYPEEVFAVWAACHHRRSIRWCADRSEDFLSATQGRGTTSHGVLGLNAEGYLVALKAQITGPLGPFIPTSGLIPTWNAARILPGGYDIPAIDITALVVPEARAPMGIYRGAGRPEAACLMERLIDKAAQASGFDPVELRLWNLHERGLFPVRTLTGNLLDSGDYIACLQALTDRADYDGARAWRARGRDRGLLRGVGLAFYLEPSGEGFETARVTWAADGSVHVASGSSSQGQSRETAYAQIAGDVLDVALDRITVIFGDTDTCPVGIGAVASRATSIGGSAVFRACEMLRARRLNGAELPLFEEVRYENEGQAWGYGAYLILVEIDAETGEIRIEAASAIDDAGRVINPALVEGQIRGGFAQGLGEALMEQIVYDDAGQLLSGSLMDYALPRATDMPPLALSSSENPSPFNALGVKGVGEAGTIGAPASLLNAVLDALSPLGITDMDMPLTPCKIWTAIQDAKEKP